MYHLIRFGIVSRNNIASPVLKYEETTRCFRSSIVPQEQCADAAFAEHAVPVLRGYHPRCMGTLSLSFGDHLGGKPPFAKYIIPVLWGTSIEVSHTLAPHSRKDMGMVCGWCTLAMAGSARDGGVDNTAERPPGGRVVNVGAYPIATSSFAFTRAYILLARGLSRSQAD